MLGLMQSKPKAPGQTSGKIFERECRAFLAVTFTKLQHLRPGTWLVDLLEQSDKHGISQYEQYAHLAVLAEMAKQKPELAAIIGQDYLITPDIVICRQPEPDEVINRPHTILSR
jgi:NgoMIV restriction enzyme